MRRLRVLYSLSPSGIPVLVLAAFVPAGEGCSTDDRGDGPHDGAVDVSAAGGSGGGGGTQRDDATAGSGGRGGGIIDPTGGVGGAAGIAGAGGRACVDAGTRPDPRYEYTTSGPVPRPCCGFYIDLPPEGTPAMIDTVCVDSGGPVQSGWAARVTLNGVFVPPLEGRITIGRALEGRVVGLPSVRVLDVSDPAFSEMIIDNIAPASFGRGYTFNFAWPRTPPAIDGARMTLEVTFGLRCEGEGGLAEAGAMQTVQALTNVVLCLDPGGFRGQWVSSGDICHVCAIIAEMAPTPIIPGAHEDPLPLAEALRLSVKTLARVGRSFVLLAEHDGGTAGFRYAWRVSSGELVHVTEDVVVWTPPDEAMLELVQVAVESERAAAVASMRWDRAA